MAIIAVSNTLTNVSSLLREEGYEVIPFSQEDLQTDVDAIVVSGENENMMGMMEVSQQVPVLNAEGMSAEQVAQSLKNRLQS